MKLLCLFALSCVLFQSCDVTGQTVSPIDESFRKHNIVPSVIATSPSYVLEISYSTNDTKVNLGNELTPTLVKDQPRLRWDDDREACTLIMMDIDAASSKPAFLHWMVGNIPGADIRKGQVLAEYIGSGPPKDSGLHRYIFLIFRQNRKINFTEPYSPNNSQLGRREFSIENFTKKYNLGNALAGNFFLAQYDDYVPIIHRQILGPQEQPKSIVERITDLFYSILQRIAKALRELFPFSVLSQLREIYNSFPQEN